MNSSQSHHFDLFDLSQTFSRPSQEPKTIFLDPFLKICSTRSILLHFLAIDRN